MTKLLPYNEGYAHWCPACKDLHYIRTGQMDGPNWSFNGSLDAPTFNPSVRVTGMQQVIKDGRWTGEWKQDANGDPVRGCCHYFLHDGMIQYLNDCTHELAGKVVPLPDASNMRNGGTK